MNQKILFLTLALILVIAIPIAVAAITHSQIVHVTGNAKYPHNTPVPTAAPTVTPVAASAVKFSLYFPNGTAYPSAVTDAISGVNTIVIDPLSGHNAGWTASCVVVKNDGSAPMTVNASLANVNVPSNLALTLNCGYYGAISGGYGAEKATNTQPIQPGQTYYMSLLAFLTPVGSYTPDQQFSYNYDVVITATQA